MYTNNKTQFRGSFLSLVVYDKMRMYLRKNNFKFSDKLLSKSKILNSQKHFEFSKYTKAIPEKKIK